MASFSSVKSSLPTRAHQKNQENENKQEMMQPDFMLHAAKNVAANLPGAKR